MNLNVTVLTSPEKNINLNSDINLLKVALLYSDKITLVSPTASMLLSVTQMYRLSDNEKFELLKSFVSTTDPESLNEIINVYNRYKEIKKKKRLKKDELLLKIKLDKAFEKITTNLYDVGMEIYEDAKFEKIIPLIDRGYVELKHFNYGIDDIQTFVLDEIIDVLTSADKYPLFDNMIEGLSHAYSIENNLVISTDNPKEIKMGKEVLFKLPNVNDLEFEQIIELKNELTQEVSRFKTVILSYSNDLNKLPYSEGDNVEILKKYEYAIRPEIEDLKEQISQNKLVKKLSSEVMSNASKYIIQTTVFIGLCDLFDFNKLISGVGFLTETAFKTYKSISDENKKIKKHPLFFYHSLEQLK